MRQRVVDIEKVIDDHFNLIKDSIYKSKVDAIERQNKKYDKKKEKKTNANVVNVKMGSARNKAAASSRGQLNSAKSSPNNQEELHNEL